MQSLRNTRGSKTKSGAKDAAEAARRRQRCGGETPSCHDDSKFGQMRLLTHGGRTVSTIKQKVQKEAKNRILLISAQQSC